MEELEQPISMPLAQGEDVSQMENREKAAQNGSMGDQSVSKYGKFKDAESLLSAYNSLQSDYTKKCQALSSLSRELKVQENSTQNEEPKEQEPSMDYSNLSKEQKEEMLQQYIFSSPDLKEKFLAKYFEELHLPMSPRLISQDKGSSFVLCDREKPTTLEEAGKIARSMLSKKD